MKTIYLCATLVAAVGCGQTHTEPAAAVGAAGAASVASIAAPRRTADVSAPALERVRRGLSHSGRELVRQQRPDGATEVPLDGRFQSATIIVKDASGKRRRMCIDQPSALDAVLGAKP